jgi:hypothetical protein
MARNKISVPLAYPSFQSDCSIYGLTVLSTTIEILALRRKQHYYGDCCNLDGIQEDMRTKNE